MAIAPGYTVWTDARRARNRTTSSRSEARGSDPSGLSGFGPKSTVPFKRLVVLGRKASEDRGPRAVTLLPTALSCVLNRLALCVALAHLYAGVKGRVMERAAVSIPEAAGRPLLIGCDRPGPSHIPCSTLEAPKLLPVLTWAYAPAAPFLHSKLQLDPGP